MIGPVQRSHQGTTLTREEGKAKLHTLTPGSYEYRQLQGALLKASGIAEIALPDSSYKVNTGCHRLIGGFGSCEHRAIGERVNLPGLEKNTPLLVKGPVEVTFQDIVALGGDFYGVAGGAISLPGGGPANQTQRFMDAFATLEQGDNNQLRMIMLEIEDESRKVQAAGLPHHCYSSQLIEKNRAMQRFKADINDLLVDNSDHFSDHAITAFEIGHARALEEARAAGRKKDLEKLKRAHAMGAFADHYLTDLFSSGHVRNQRGQLEIFLITNLGFDSDAAKALAGILTGAQHEKEGHEGLNVVNGKKDQWRAYGDGHFSSPKNKENGDRAVAAVQQAVNEIDLAYRFPDQQTQSIVVSEHIPRATDYNPPPLYSITNNTLVLNQDGEEIPIKTSLDFYTKAIALALRYLPEDYINGTINEVIKDATKKKIYQIFKLDIGEKFAEIKKFFDPAKKTAEIANKILMPRIERFTSSIWHIIGIATYYQVKKGSEELNAKIHEMADTLNATYGNTVKILEQLAEVKIKLELLDWDNKSENLRNAIEQINKMANQTKHFSRSLNESEQLNTEKELWAAYMTISTIFGKGTAFGQMMLVIYQTMLESDKSLSEKEIKIQVTHWFRQMLDCQVQAVSLYAEYVLRRPGGYQELQKKMPGFQSNLLEQFEVNRPLIDEELLFQSPSHIAHALETHKFLNTVNQIESK